MNSKRLLSVLICLLLFTIFPIKIAAESNIYYWAISKDLETLYLSPSELNNDIEDLYVKFGSFEADINTTWVMPWSEYISVDSNYYNPTETVKNVVIVEGMKPKSITRWFWDFENLEEVDLTKLDTSELLYMQETFAGCKNLTSVNVGNFNTKKVVNFESTFNGLEKLEVLDISSFDIKEDAEISGTSGFFIDNLPSLKTLKLPRTIKTEFPSPEHFKWVNPDGNVVEIVSSVDANQTLTKVNSYDLVVNNVLVTDTNCDDVLKDGKVSYDPLTSTLTLDNVVLDKLYHDPFNNDYAVIYVEHSLNINLIGENQIIIPQVADVDDDWVSGIYFPMMADDNDYQLVIDGEKLKITGSGNSYNRGIMSYDSDCVITNKADLTIDIFGEHARGIDIEDDFHNEGVLIVNASGTSSWGINLDRDSFYNTGYVLTKADVGAYCAKEVVGEQHLLKGSIDKGNDISDYKEVEFISYEDEPDNPHYDEFVIDGERVQALVMCATKLEPTYTWSNDYSKCKAEAICEKCGHKESEEVHSSCEKTPASVTSNEINTYTAVFANPLFEKQVKKVEIPGTKIIAYIVPNTGVN